MSPLAREWYAVATIVAPISSANPARSFAATMIAFADIGACANKNVAVIVAHGSCITFAPTESAKLAVSKCPRLSGALESFALPPADKRLFVTLTRKA